MSFLLPGPRPGHPKNIPRWHIYYFELKLFDRQPMQEGRTDPPFSPWMQEINLPCDRCPPSSREVRETPLSSELRNSGPESCINKTCYFFTNLLAKSKLCLDFPLMSTQTEVSLSCQFFTNIPFLCLEGVKSWLGHHFSDCHFWSPVVKSIKLLFLLLIRSQFNFIISPAIRTPRGKGGNFPSSTPLCAFVL